MLAAVVAARPGTEAEAGGGPTMPGTEVQWAGLVSLCRSLSMAAQEDHSVCQITPSRVVVENVLIIFTARVMIKIETKV